jgi:hypothetical protein
MIRMNLNTFARHGVFDEPGMTDHVVAARLRDASEIARARVFPYQLLAAYRSADPEVPVRCGGHSRRSGFCRWAAIARLPATFS